MEENQNSLELVESRSALELVPAWEPQAWWFFAAVALVILLLLLVHLFRSRKKVEDPDREKREAYKEAKADFHGHVAGNFREAAAWVSMVLRRYLARSMGEPALFETHEEFVSRHDGLKDLPDDVRREVGDFFTILAALKYAPEEGAPVTAEEITAGGTDLLERIHRS
jgi:hypothetical protein